MWKGEDDAQDDTVRLYVSYLQGKLKWIGSSVKIAESLGGFRLLAGAAARHASAAGSPADNSDAPGPSPAPEELA